MNITMPAAARHQRQSMSPTLMGLVLAFDCCRERPAVAVLPDGATLAVHREEGREAGRAIC